jgi:hypothetical protein
LCALLDYQGDDPSLIFSDKKNEKALLESMKEKFHTFQGQHDLDVAIICDPTIRFVTQELSFKLLRKCRKDQVPVIFIATIEKCVKGMLMNWVTFFLNQFLIDFEKVKDKGTEFHYACILILIALLTWREMDNTQF